ncbi:hypothetical protein GC174_09635 [bacterium]|nr:hypothetical protein [bacterium]
MSNQVLIFNLGPHRACMELEDVVQVYDSVSFEEIGDVDPAVLGMINIRGQTVPLIDIKPRWNQAPRSVELSDQIVVFKSRGITVSIIVDKVLGTKTVPEKRIVALADIVDDSLPHKVIATPDGMMILLDCQRLFSEEFLAPFSRIGIGKDKGTDQEQ